MIVPRYWAEGRLQHRDRKRGQFTVRRFGWSDANQEEAQANADQRTSEALARLVAGEKLPGREPKVPYNGAEGVPIREEVISRYGETVITRNSYGARCLNTPDVLFADIDIHPPPTRREILTAVRGGVYSVVAVVGLAWLGLHFLAWVMALWIFASVCVLINLAWRGWHAWQNSERKARERLRRYTEDQPGWNLRVYRTPAGLRVLATHRLFRPESEPVSQFFQDTGADKVYAQMCRRQGCFRARVSAKPWRIGITERLRPRGGTWPVAQERLPARAAWVETYEAVASGFAACAFVESAGSGVVDPDVRECMELHDTLCDARSGKPLA